MNIPFIGTVNPVLFIAVVVLIVLVVVFIAMTIYGSKQKKKAEENQKALEAAQQPMSLLIIDKKRMKIKDANLPKFVMENIPKRMMRSKVPIIKAKAGPKIMTFMCDDTTYDMIPVKQEVKAMVSGIYIMSVRGLRGATLTPPPKQGFFTRLFSRKV